MFFQSALYVPRKPASLEGECARLTLIPIGRKQKGRVALLLDPPLSTTGEASEVHHTAN